jgi:hypothetical protein
MLEILVIIYVSFKVVDISHSIDHTVLGSDIGSDLTKFGINFVLLTTLQSYPLLVLAIIAGEIYYRKVANK